MYTFIEKISKEYHSPNSFLGESYSGKAMKQKDVEAKLNQRSLTLLGSSSLSNTNQPGRKKRIFHPIPGSQSRKKRKRSLRDVVNDENGKHSYKHIIDTNSFTTQTFVSLNRMWENYSYNVLGKKCKNRKNEQMVHDISRILDRIEMIGAYVSIVKCNSSPSYIGKIGIVVDETANTWKVAAPDVKRGQEIRDFSMQNMKKDLRWNVITVAKRNSVLALRIKTNMEEMGESTRDDDYCFLEMSR